MPAPRSKSVKVDFSGVESGGTRHIPDGRYAGKVSKVEMKVSDNSGKPYLSWQFSTQRPSHKGATVYHNTSLQPQALFNLKGLLEAMGEEVPDGEMDLDLKGYVDNEIGYEIVNEEYQGKQRPQIVGFFPADELEGAVESASEGDEDATEPSFKKGSRVKFKDDDGRTQKGVVLSVDEESVTVDVKGEEWQVEISDLSAAD